MFTVRDVLDRLPGVSLIPLSRARGLVISGPVDDCRARLARHFGRRIGELLETLRRVDLSKLFRSPFEVDGVTYRLRNRGRYTKGELLEMAQTLFVRGEIHERFSILNLGVVDEGEDGDEDGDGDEDDGDNDDNEESEEEPEEEPEADGDEGDDEGAVPAAVQELKGWLHLDTWSAGRSLKRVLSIVYGRAFTRLHIARFQRLLADLHGYGIELCLADDPDGTPLDLDAWSPGLDATVRLRLRAEEEAVDGGDEEEEVDDGEEPEEEVDDGPDPDALPAPLRHLLAAIADGDWSRPRTVSRLLTVLYDREFSRLRAERFQRLLRDLDAAGVEACIADHPDRAPLALDADSPGLEAPLCLRRRPADARYAATIAMTMVTNPPPPSAPLPPVQVVPDPGGRISQVPMVRMTPYELALLRLEFLTAVPSVDRARDPAWPDGFLDAASRGLDLDERSQRFLRLAANTFVSGSHDPTVRVSRLTRVLHPDDWPMLLIDFERLNPEVAPALVGEVLRLATELASLPQEPVARVLPPPAAPPQGRPEPAPLPRAAAIAQKPSAAARPRGDEGGHDRRDLGALKGMFDD